VKLEVREEVRQLAQPLADEAGYELVDVEFGVEGRHRAIRVLLDKPGGITLGDCAQFSRRLADCLDMNQIVPWSYHLEVSSPGIQRPIRTLEAATRFAGRRVSVATVTAHDGRRHYEGDLLGPDDGRIGLRIDEGQELWFEWTDIKSARLVVDPWAEARRRVSGSRGEERDE
jgi:ribosome maturation factor RimP